MELVVAGLAAVAIYFEWKQGRITLPLIGYDKLATDIAAFALEHRIASLGMTQPEDRPSGAITYTELEGYLRSQLRSAQFPRNRIHDLRKAVCVRLRRNPYWYAAAGDYVLKRAFDQVAQLHDNKVNEWAS